MNNNSNRHSVLLEQISYWAKKVGRASARPVLLLWFVMTSSNTPKSEKIMLASAIAYVVLPIDLISAKRIPIIGWLDEVVSLSQLPIRKSVSTSLLIWREGLMQFSTVGLWNTLLT